MVVAILITIAILGTVAIAILITIAILGTVAISVLIAITYPTKSDSQWNSLLRTNDALLHPSGVLLSKFSGFVMLESVFINLLKPTSYVMHQQV